MVKDVSRADALAKAPPSREVFDPWNSVSTGHQRAENRLASSTGWRDSRTAKLQNQFAGGLANDGGERAYDLVGAGARDEGLEYMMQREAFARGRNGEKWGNVEDWLRTEGGVRKPGLSNHETTGSGKLLHATNGVMRTRENQWLLGFGKHKAKADASFAENYTPVWDGSAREEAICQIAGKKRTRDGPPEDLTISDLSPTYLAASAEDSDEIWDPLLEQDEQSVARESDRVNPESSEKTGADNTTTMKLGSSERSTLTLQLAMDDDEIWDPELAEEPTSQPNNDEHQQQSLENRNSASPILEGSARPISPSKLLTLPPTPIFRGLTFYISGSTMPLISDHALRQLLVSHGADICLGIAKRKVTHVVMSRPSSADSSTNDNGAGAALAAGKLQREALRVRSSGGKGTRYVVVEWVLESIRNRRRLSEARFAIGEASTSLPMADRTTSGNDSKNYTSKPTQKHTQKQSGPLTEEERAAIGAAVQEWEHTGAYESGYRSKGGEGSGSEHRRWKRKAEAAVTMPGAPAGQRSVRSMFMRQAKEQAWEKAGFKKTK